MILLSIPRCGRSCFPTHALAICFDTDWTINGQTSLYFAAAVFILHGIPVTVARFLVSIQASRRRSTTSTAGPSRLEKSAYSCNHKLQLCVWVVQRWYNKTWTPWSVKIVQLYLLCTPLQSPEYGGSVSLRNVGMASPSSVFRREKREMLRLCLLPAQFRCDNKKSMPLDTGRLSKIILCVENSHVNVVIPSSDVLYIRRKLDADYLRAWVTSQLEGWGWWVGNIERERGSKTPCALFPSVPLPRLAEHRVIV